VHGDVMAVEEEQVLVVEVVVFEADKSAAWD
jgi:hypothetical protein